MTKKGEPPTPVSNPALPVANRQPHKPPPIAWSRGQSRMRRSSAGPPKVTRGAGRAASYIFFAFADLARGALINGGDRAYSFVEGGYPCEGLTCSFFGNEVRPTSWKNRTPHCTRTFGLLGSGPVKSLALAAMA